MRGERLQRNLQPVTAEHGRVQAAGHGAQLLERGRDLAPRPLELSRRLGVVRQVPLEHAQLERERDEPLLGAVVEVALEPLALLLAGLDHARARALELLQLRLLLGLQAAVLERDRRPPRRPPPAARARRRARGRAASAAMRAPSLSTSVVDRPLAGPGSRTGRPSRSAQVSNSGSQ